MNRDASIGQLGKDLAAAQAQATSTLKNLNDLELLHGELSISHETHAGTNTY
jgi:hypothetical protein